MYCMFVLLFAFVGVQAEQLDTILNQYEKGLTDLIEAHQKMFPQSAISVATDPLIFTAYGYLIAPSAMWINQYCSIVASEIVRDMDYADDLQKLYDEYNVHAQKVKTYVELFAPADQKVIAEIFYQKILQSILNVCLRIIKHNAFAYHFDLKNLKNSWIAYQMAYQVLNDLQNTTISSQYTTQLISDMQNLFQAAINQTQSSLQQAMSDDEQVEQKYERLLFCANVLYQVYVQNGQTDQAQNQQNMLNLFKEQQKNYTQAMQVETQANQTIAVLQKPYRLMVSDAQAQLTNIQKNITGLQKLAVSYQNAAQLYQQAVDIVGQTRAQNQSDMITDFDVVLNFVQKLWAMFLVDQSANGVFTFPTIIACTQGSTNGQNQNMIQALQTLTSMISADHVATNNMQTLLSSNDNITLSFIFTQYILPFMQMHSASADLIKNNLLFDIALLTDVNHGLMILESWAFSLMNAISNNDLESAAHAVAYAKYIDQKFEKNENLNQYIPFLPDALSQDNTWKFFTALCLQNTGIVLNVQQALKLQSATPVVITEPWTNAQIQEAENNAATIFSQAAAAAQSYQFSTASMLYQKAMNAYKTLIMQASSGQDEISFAQQANLGQTRFTAFSFASLVQSIGSSDNADFTQVPERYIANSYTLTVDPSMVNNSLPQCLKQLQEGVPLVLKDQDDKQSVLRLVKAYLVAQLLADQGNSFSTYFSDYVLTQVQPDPVASSIVAQISQYLKDSEKISPISVTKNSDESLSILISKFPLAKVQGICTTVPCALEFLISAGFLLAQGSQPLSLAGQVYQPGNDPISSAYMYQQAGMVYVSQALSFIEQMDGQIKQALGLIKKNLTISDEVVDLQNQIEQCALSAQAMVSKSVMQSASTCFLKSGQTALVQNAEKLFFNIYQKQINFLEKCLVGDPTSAAYQNTLSAINALYVAWASQVDDQTQIETINQAIAALYQTAGDNAVKFKYQQKSFPGFKQIHYMAVGQYYAAAQKQYALLKNNAKAAELKEKIQDLNFKGALQNIALYNFVKAQGATFMSDSGVLQTVSYDQLSIDFLNATNNGVTIDPNELNLYSKVQDLLVDAAIVFEQLSMGSATQTTKNKDAVYKDILTWLNTQKIVGSVYQHFAEIPLSDTQAILNAAFGLYTAFSKDANKLAASSELLFDMVKNQYLIDYLAATQQDAEITLAQKTQEFLSTLNQEAQNIANPPQGYIQ